MDHILHIPRLSSADERSLELEGARFDVACLNWPDSFPYAPVCAGRIGYTADALVVGWRVSGLDLTVRNTVDGGTIWEDSCCEIFLQAPGSGDYYNIEVNAGGFLLVGRGPGRAGRVLLPPSEMARIVRLGGVKAPVDVADQLCDWHLTVIIPWEVIGLPAAPASLSGNIYKCGDKTAHPHFLSWAPVGTLSPDFHRPEFFGRFVLEQ